MKGNIKKLAVLVIVPVITLFIMAAMASAKSAIPHGIKGQFAATGISICSMDPGGFTDNGGVLIPNDPTEVSIGTSTWDAGFTFNNDGTGSAEGTLRSIPLMGDPFGPLPVGSGVPMPFTYQFTYTVTKEGAITFTLVPHTYIVAGGAACFDAIPKDGAISGDGKTITIACGAPVVLTFIDCKTFAPSTAQNLCNASLVLIKQ